MRVTRHIAVVGLVGLLSSTVWSQEVRVSISLRPDQVRRTHQGGFDRVDLVDAAHTVTRSEAQPGQPDLPALRLRIALPPGAKPGAPRLERVRLQRLVGQTKAAPAQPERALRPRDPRFPRPATAPTPPNQAAYASRQAYPAQPVRLTDVGQLGSVPLAFVDLVPFELIPAAGTLALMTDVEVVVPYTPAALPQRASRIRPTAGLVENPAPLRPAPIPPLPQTRDTPLLILTSNCVWLDAERSTYRKGRDLGSLSGAFQALAADHTALGLDARVVTVSQVVAGAFGDFTVNAAGLPARDLCEVLRNFLQDCAYPKWGVRYLLLGGDTQVVPVRRILNRWGWVSRPGDWTASDPWNVFSAVCRSWWPGSLASVQAMTQFPSPGAERLIDGDDATGWSPRGLLRPYPRSDRAPDLSRRSARAGSGRQPAAPARSALPRPGRALPPRPSVNRPVLDLTFEWPSPIWPTFNRLGLTWDQAPSSWKPIRVLVSNDDGLTWSSRGEWPADAAEMTLGRGEWLELGSKLRVRLVFTSGWPTGRELMEVSMFGAQTTSYPVDPTTELVVSPNLDRREPLLYQSQGGAVIPDLIPYDEGASETSPGWYYVDRFDADATTVPSSIETDAIVVRGPAAWFSSATHWVRARSPQYYAADAYYGDLEGPSYVGGAAFDLQNPWHDFDKNDDGWCSPTGDGVDKVFEVAVGRAPVDSVAQAALYTQKARTYLRYQDLRSGQGGQSLGSFGGRGLLGAKKLWNGSVAGDEGYTSRESILSSIWQLQDPSIQAERHYEHPDPFPGAQPLAGLLPAFDRGFNRVGIISHSGPDYCCEFRPQNVMTATNAPFYSVVFSYGCSPNAFDWPLYDSVSEGFLNAPAGGACAFLGNTRYGWGGDYVIENAFWQATSITPRLGDMLHAREARNVDSPWLRYNLLGDPGLPVWVKTPRRLHVSAVGLTQGPQPMSAATLRGGPAAGRYVFRVRSGRYAVAGALVVVTRRGQAVTRGTTDAQGRVVLRVPRGATIGVSALSTPATPNRAYVPVILPMRSLVVTRTPSPRTQRAKAAPRRG